MFTRLFVKLLTVTHLFLYRATRGLVGNRITGMPVMLLTTIGSRTGKARTIPITYVRSGDNYVLTASNGGSDKNPSWFINIQRNPEAYIRLGGKKMKAYAAMADGATRTLLWAQLISSAPWYANYQKRTKRQIPMVILRLDDP